MNAWWLRNLSGAVVGSLAALVFPTLAAQPAHAVTINMVPVGDPGNVNDTTGYGGVANSYRIAQHLVTIQQYTDFLNAAAKSDPYSLYDTNMGTNLNIAGISRSGGDGNYSYSVIDNGGPSGNRPITYVTWFDAARFANWMQNGQGSGSTETGAYTLNGRTTGNAVAKNPGATFYIPTENEWYKAAYYKGGGTNAGYWDYAMQSDSTPGNAIGSAANQTNYKTTVFAVTQSSTKVATQNYLTDVGAFTNSASFYGTFDQSGSVYEWNDLDESTLNVRGLRGGGWDGSAATLSVNTRVTSFTPDQTSERVGFRLAQPVPEPATLGLTFGGALCACGSWVLQRRRRARTLTLRQFRPAGQ